MEPALGLGSSWVQRAVSKPGAGRGHLGSIRESGPRSQASGQAPASLFPPTPHSKGVPAAPALTRTLVLRVEQPYSRDPAGYTLSAEPAPYPRLSFPSGGGVSMAPLSWGKTLTVATWAGPGPGCSGWHSQQDCPSVCQSVPTASSPLSNTASRQCPDHMQMADVPAATVSAGGCDE